MYTGAAKGHYMYTGAAKGHNMYTGAAQGHYRMLFMLFTIKL